MEQISTALGGQAAEDLIFKDISTGASNDLEVANSIARDMVMEYGMSDLGPLNLKSRGGMGLYRAEEGTQISEQLQAKIDAETKKILDTAFKQSKDILMKNKAKLDKVAKALLQDETLDTEEFEKIVGKKKTNFPKATQSTVMA